MDRPGRLVAERGDVVDVVGAERTQRAAPEGLAYDGLAAPPRLGQPAVDDGEHAAHPAAVGTDVVVPACRRTRRPADQPGGDIRAGGQAEPGALAIAHRA